MHRNPAATGGSGIGNNTSGGVPRDTTRPDPGFSTLSTASLTSRRPAPLTPYKLKCEQEPLSTRLGPPDFFPPAPQCAEELLTRDACQLGYKEAVEGIEEHRETALSLVNQPVWAKPLINKYKESIRKGLRVLNNAHVRKRKAGQVYGVPLSGPFLTKLGQYPEQRPCGEDSRKKWIEDLAQHKRLKVLADHVPHGLRKRALFEALIKNEVPFLRATWFIKVTYLNQSFVQGGRPLSIGMSAGGGDKLQLKRLELWTKDILEFIQPLLDDLSQHGSTTSFSLGRDSSPLLPSANSSQHGSDFTQGTLDGDDQSLQKKWQYMVRLMQLHYSEGLLHRAQVVEWLLKQLQEKEVLDALELLLPLILNLIDDVSVCQTYVRTLVDVSLQKLKVLCPVGSLPDSSEQPRHLYVATFFAELIHYLLAAVPDSFVALDCFPLPSCIYARSPALEICWNDPGVSDDKREGTTSLLGGQEPSTLRAFSARELLVTQLADTIQKRAALLGKAVNSRVSRKNEGNVIQSLDRALIAGDISAAYHCVFDEDFCSYEQLPDGWLTEVSPFYKLSPGILGNAIIPEVFAVRFLCEWAVCDFRDCRRMPNSADRKNANARDFCRVYMAVSVLCLRMEELTKQKCLSISGAAAGSPVAGLGFQMLSTGTYGYRSKKSKEKKVSSHVQHPNIEGNVSSKATLLSTFFASPGPVHDILVAWLDQHEIRRGEGFERVQLLLWELVNKGLFWPPAYVRHLTVSGVLEKKETTADLERASRHKRLLQHLPGLPGLHMDEDGMGFSDPSITEAIRLYRNERRLALHGFDLLRPKISRKEGEHFYQLVGQDFLKEVRKNVEACSETSDSKFPLEFPNTGCKVKRAQRKKMKVLELKQAIARCLHIPEWCVMEQPGTLMDTCNSWQATSKNQILLYGNILDKTEVTPGCEECGRSKKQKVNDSKSVFSQGQGMSPKDEDERWWVKKKPKEKDVAKVEPSAAVKPPKQPPRGRPKAVRKLSLAQLAAARIEGNQGASSSHTCDSKVHCPYHKSALEGHVLSQSKESQKIPLTSDLKSVGNALKHLRLGERRVIATWLDNTVRNLLEGSDRAASVSTASHHSVGYGVCTIGTPAVDERSYTRWQLNEEELAAILYFLDLSSDFQSLIRLLLWLLPKANIPPVLSLGSSNRTTTTGPWNKESSMCDIGEATILTCLRRYEGVLTSAGLLPEALSAGMQRAAKVIASVPGGRVACLSLFSYVRDLYKRYSGFSSFQMWEKNWKACSDQRLILELDAIKVGEGEVNFSMLGVAIPGVGDDRDDPVPPRLMGRLKGLSYMKDVVHRGFHDVIGQMVSKERELSMSGGLKDFGLERWDEGLQASQHVLTSLLECIKQHSANAPHGDTQLAAAAASAVVSNVGSAVAGVFESFTSNNSYSCSTPGIGPSTKCARRVLQAHIHCLRLLKEAFGERQNRGLESALASEAISIVANAIGHTSGRAPRAQFQLSPETPDPSSALVGEFGPGSTGLTLGRLATAAGVAALVVGLVLSGVIGLEKLISLLKIKEGLENLPVLKSSSSNPNGMSRVITSGNPLKGDMAEVSLFWFRVLIGDCRSVAGCLVAHILGESSLVEFTRMQRLLPLSTTLIPAYALFSTALRSQHLSFTIGSNREDMPFLQTVFTALGELLSHEPFREICLQDTGALYLLLVGDTGDFEYASLLDMKGADSYLKMSSMVPSRARLFLHAILDRKMPALPDDKNYTQKLGNIKSHHVKELVQVLDELQPATFHWQWVELRLLLNEQVFIEKIESQNLPAAEAVQAITSASENAPLSESEKTFTEIVLTRLLVRPDAAGLYSGALHLLGRAFEEFLIRQVQWILNNNDMLFGRKSLRQQLEEIAHRKDYRLGCGRVKAWGWLPPQEENCMSSNESEKRPEVVSPEEGEVAEEGVDWRKESRQGNGGILVSGDSGILLRKHFAIEKALADLVLPCLAHSTPDRCSGFAIELVKQMNELEQHVSLLTCSCGRPMLTTPEAAGSKGLGLRKGPRTGLECSNPGRGRMSVTSVSDSSPPSTAALQTSMWLRLQFLLPLLPLIHADREPTARNMRLMLAPVLLRLLGTRVVQESVEPRCSLQGDCFAVGHDFEGNAEVAAVAAATAAGEGLFDRLLSVLHALLSSSRAVWLKQQKPACRGATKPILVLDREIAERMQADLDHMQLSPMVRVRLQAAMPILSASSTLSISAGPPQVPSAALHVVQTSVFSTNSTSIPGPVIVSHRAPFRPECSIGKGKPPPLQDPDLEIDPWILLEDGTGSGVTGGGNGGLVRGESGNMKACAWLKGAVRVQRTDLTYVGSLDDYT